MRERRTLTVMHSLHRDTYLFVLSLVWLAFLLVLFLLPYL
jgi:hypothetical protein